MEADGDGTKAIDGFIEKFIIAKSKEKITLPTIKSKDASGKDILVHPKTGEQVFVDKVTVTLSPEEVLTLADQFKHKLLQRQGTSPISFGDLPTAASQGINTSPNPVLDKEKFNPSNTTDTLTVEQMKARLSELKAQE